MTLKEKHRKRDHTLYDMSYLAERGAMSVVHDAKIQNSYSSNIMVLTVKNQTFMCKWVQMIHIDQ